MKSKEQLIAKQFTSVYDEREDRLRLIVNLNYPTRYDLWITRAFLIKLLDELSKFSLPEIEEEPPSTNQSDAKEPAIYPSINTPHLVESVNITTTKDGFTITIEDGSTQIVTTLSAQELKKLISLILRTVRFAWGLYF
ncbi:hypothetical protein NitYY0814_C1492 [Nitratiruptor sp. YY08-14]|nr:hypothetical protein NitYY0810_C1483 [Nitratiruptor sp. YY08-10]BCD64638.1 hypothetical protein NitYY0814_C1492 [Nitratiruptor sp. YY08-14]